MVTKGKPILDKDSVEYTVPHGEHRATKKFHWICDVCGSQFFYQGDAKDCEVSHRPVKKLPTYDEVKEMGFKKLYLKCKPTIDAWEQRNGKITKETFIAIEEKEYQMAKANGTVDAHHEFEDCIRSMLKNGGWDRFVGDV